MAGLTTGQMFPHVEVGSSLPHCSQGVSYLGGGVTCPVAVWLSLLRLCLVIFPYFRSTFSFAWCLEGGAGVMTTAYDQSLGSHRAFTKAL